MLKRLENVLFSVRKASGLYNIERGKGYCPQRCQVSQELLSETAGHFPSAGVLTVWKGILHFGVWLKNRGMAFVPHPLYSNLPPYFYMPTPTPFILCTLSHYTYQVEFSLLFLFNYPLLRFELTTFQSEVCHSILWAIEVIVANHPWLFSHKLMSKFGN